MHINLKVFMASIHYTLSPRQNITMPNAVTIHTIVYHSSYIPTV